MFIALFLCGLWYGILLFYLRWALTIDWRPEILSWGTSSRMAAYPERDESEGSWSRYADLMIRSSRVKTAIQYDVMPFFLTRKAADPFSPEPWPVRTHG